MMLDEQETATDEKPARERYDSVHVRWPETIPPLEPEEAISAAKRLYRFGMKRRWRGAWEATSGNRYTYPRRGVFRVNYTGHRMGGWRDLVHDLSHFVHQQRHPRARPHDIRHEIIEREMVEHVVRSGWLDGRLRRKEKPAPSKEQRDEAKLAHAVKMLRRATTRRARAQTIEKKWARRVRALERKAGDK